MSSSPLGPRIFAWAGAGLFAGSLLYFLFSYVVTFAEIAPRPIRAADVATNLGLFSVFAVHHSLFARERMRAFLARTLSPGLERSVYVWVASLMLIAVCAWWRPLPGVAWHVEGAAAWIFPVVQLAGAWLSVRSAAVIDIWDLAGTKQVSAGGPEGPPLRALGPAGGPSGPLGEFKTDGPYGWVRHPIYLGWFLLVFSMPAMTVTRLAFALISCAYVLLAIPLEERSLLRNSAGRYADYMRKVPWKLVPHVY